eukprot:1188571-Prorocentrum_minimum.AAC.2
MRHRKCGYILMTDQSAVQGPQHRLQSAQSRCTARKGEAFTLVHLDARSGTQDLSSILGPLATPADALRTTNDTLHHLGLQPLYNPSTPPRQPLQTPCRPDWAVTHRLAAAFRCGFVPGGTATRKGESAALGLEDHLRGPILRRPQRDVTPPPTAARSAACAVLAATETKRTELFGG